MTQATAHFKLPAFYLLLFGVVISLISGLELSLLGTIGWSSLPLGLIAGLCIYALVFYASVKLMPILPSLRDNFYLLRRLFADLSWGDIVVLSLLAGIGEELLIRGVLQGFLMQQFGSWTGIILASLVFALLHTVSFVYVLITFMIGLVFAIAYTVTGSLLLVMAAHSIYDVCAFAVVVKWPHLLRIKH